MKYIYFLLLCPSLLLCEELKIKAIHFIGISEQFQNELKDSLYNKSPSYFNKMIRKYPPFIENFREIDKNTIIRFFNNKGYLNIQLSDSIHNITDNKIEIIYSIQLNKQFIINKIEIKGNHFFPVEYLKKKMRQKENNPYSPYQSYADSIFILQLYQNSGYLDGKVTANRSFVSDSLIILSYEINEGIRYKINENIYTGNKNINKWLIRRELTFKKNEYYSYDEVKKSSRNLFETNFFSYVSILPIKTNEPSIVNMNITIQERQTRTFLFNINYEQFEQQSANLYTDTEYTIRNLFENGWVLRVNPAYSFNLRNPNLYQRFSFDILFLENWFLNFKLPFTFNPSYSDLKTDLYHYNEYGASFRFRNSVTRYGYLINKIALIKKNFRGGLTEDLENEVGEGLHSIWELTLEKDTRDNIFDPTKGSYFKIQQSISGWGISKNNNYYKWVMDWNRYKGRIHARLKIGFAGSFKKNSPYPLEERFFGGGANSWRGYNERSIGYLDKTSNKKLGGQIMILGNFIFRLWQWKFIRHIAFIDGGNIFLNWENIDLKDQKIGTGTGIHFLTPIGPIRFEFALPLDKKSSFSTIQFHFAFMPMF